MTKEGKDRIYCYYDILVRWNYSKGYIYRQMKKYLLKEEYKYFVKRILS